jgi:hypothetical protein
MKVIDAQKILNDMNPYDDIIFKVWTKKEIDPAIPNHQWDLASRYVEGRMDWYSVKEDILFTIDNLRDMK